MSKLIKHIINFIKIKIMKSTSLILILLTMASIFASAQQLTGRIINSETGKPVPLANILTLGYNTITTSDKNGNFKIDFRGNFDTVTVLFSSVGYNKFYLKLNAKTLSSLNGHFINIILDPKSYVINEVEIEGHRPKFAEIKVSGK